MTISSGTSPSAHEIEPPRYWSCTRSVRYGRSRSRQYDSPVGTVADITAIEKKAWNGKVTSITPKRARGTSRRGDGSTPMIT